MITTTAFPTELNRPAHPPICAPGKKRGRSRLETAAAPPSRLSRSPVFPTTRRAMRRARARCGACPRPFQTERKERPMTGRTKFRFEIEPERELTPQALGALIDSLTQTIGQMLKPGAEATLTLRIAI